MKTVLLSPELFLAEGGIARIMRLYLKGLCENAAPGDTITSVVLNDSPADDPRLAQFSTAVLDRNIGCQRSKAACVRAVWQATRSADLIICGHLHQLTLVWFIRQLRPQLRCALVAHGIEVWRPYRPLERRALLATDRILCISDYTRRQLLRFEPRLDPARLLIVPNTMDPFFAPPADAPLPPPNLRGPRILTVARLTSHDTYKGVDTLIEALPLVRRTLPFAHLRIVGGGDDLPRLQLLAQRLGVAASCHFTGIVDDAALRAEYAACDLFALPSRKEGFGLVYLEAMIHGKACLGARAGGVPEVIDERVGALADYGNIPDIAAALVDLVRHPRDSAAIRRQAESFAYPAFRARLAAALA